MRYARLLMGAWLVLVFGGCGPSIPSPSSRAPGVSFTGTWASTWGRLKLLQRGDHVHGTFDGFREGSISGDAEGDVLKFKWTQLVPTFEGKSPDKIYGRGYFQITSDGDELVGRWGYDTDYVRDGVWKASRLN